MADDTKDRLVKIAIQTEAAKERMRRVIEVEHAVDVIARVLENDMARMGARGMALEAEGNLEGAEKVYGNVKVIKDAMEVLGIRLKRERRNDG